MSIANEITRLTNAKAALKTAINAKGRSITDETIDEFAAEVTAIETGSSGIPAYDSLEEITSPTEGMVVKINGQEGGYGTPKIFEVGDVLPAGEILITGYTHDSDGEAFILFGNDPYCNISVSDGNSTVHYEFGTYIAYNYGNVLDFVIDLSSVPLAYRTVSSVTMWGSKELYWASQSPANPDKYYIYKDSAWVELVDLADVITISTTDLEDGVSSLTTGTYYFVIEE